MSQSMPGSVQEALLSGSPHSSGNKTPDARKPPPWSPRGPDYVVRERGKRLVELNEMTDHQETPGRISILSREVHQKAVILKFTKSTLV